MIQLYDVYKRLILDIRKLDSFYNIYKTLLKMDQIFKFKSKNYETLWQKTLGANLHDHGFGNVFLNITPKTQATTTKNEVGFIKISNFVFLLYLIEVYYYFQ